MTIDSVLRFQSVTFCYPESSKPVLSDVSWEMVPGTWCAVLGPNGVGKSTALKLMAGELEPTSGFITRKFSSHEMIYVPQHTPFGGVSFRVAQVVDMSRRAISSQGLIISPEEWMEVFGIAEIWDTRLDHLSVGQRQRLMLGLYLLKPAKILIMDEPTNGCDIAHANHIFQVITRVQERLGITVIHVSHEIHQVMMFAKEVICLGPRGHWHRHVGDIPHKLLEDAYGCELLTLVRVHKKAETEHISDHSRQQG